MKYDILTEHPRMFWFPMIINEYTADFQSTKTSKDAKFKQCLYLKLPPPLLWAEPMRRMHFTASLMPGRTAWDTRQGFFDV